MSAQEYIITYRQRLSPEGLKAIRDFDPLSIEEVTPEGWTRRIYTREETGHELGKADQ